MAATQRLSRLGASPTKLWRADFAGTALNKSQLAQRANSAARRPPPSCSSARNSTAPRRRHCHPQGIAPARNNGHVGNRARHRCSQGNPHPRFPVISAQTTVTQSDLSEHKVSEPDITRVMPPPDYAVLEAARNMVGQPPAAGERAVIHPIIGTFDRAPRLTRRRFYLGAACRTSPALTRKR